MNDFTSVAGHVEMNDFTSVAGHVEMNDFTSVAGHVEMNDFRSVSPTKTADTQPSTPNSGPQDKDDKDSDEESNTKKKHSCYNGLSPFDCSTSNIILLCIFMAICGIIFRFLPSTKNKE